MNIETLHWDPLLLHTFSISTDILPEIKSSSEVYGKVKCSLPIDGIPISGVSLNLARKNPNKLNVCFRF